MKIDVEFNDIEIIDENLKIIQSENDLSILTKFYSKYDNALKDETEKEEPENLFCLEVLKRITTNRLIRVVMENNGYKMIDGYWKAAECEDAGQK